MNKRQILCQVLRVLLCDFKKMKKKKKWWKCYVNLEPVTSAWTEESDSTGLFLVYDHELVT